MDQIINFDLLGHPYNWVVVILILYLAVFALNLLMQAPLIPPMATLGF